MLLSINTILKDLICITSDEINPYTLSGPVHPYQLDESISNFRGAWFTFSILIYFE